VPVGGALRCGSVRLVVAVLSAGVLLFASFAPPAGARTHAATTVWYWTPALCKSSLRKEGMQLYDGRTFNVADAYCVGWGGPTYCEWSSGYRYRLYTRFTAYVRSYDSTVRTFTLKPTSGNGGYTASGIRVIGHEPSSSRFNALVQPIAHALAALEQQKGCARYSP
jgi:hypothetical protein